MFDSLLLRNTFRIGFLCCVLSASVVSADEVPIVNRWRGQSRDNTLKAAAPVNGMITDAKSWNVLWQKWRGESNLKTPEIDFDANLVIVALAHGPNNVSVRTLERDGTGAVNYRAMSTRRGGPGFGYLLMEVPRDGITSVRNQPLPAPGAQAPGVRLSTERPGLVRPNSNRPAPVRPGIVRPGDAKLSQRGDFIHVTIAGTFQTGIVAIGGETTGTTITSNDVTWELDLSKDRGMQNAAGKLQGQRVQVTGLLIHKRGVEVADRWIVEVQNLVLKQ